MLSRDDCQRWKDHGYPQDKSPRIFVTSDYRKHPDSWTEINRAELSFYKQGAIKHVLAIPDTDGLLEFLRCKFPGYAIQLRMGGTTNGLGEGSSISVCIIGITNCPPLALVSEFTPIAALSAAGLAALAAQE